MKVAGSADVSVVTLTPGHPDASALQHRFLAAWKSFNGEKVKINGTPIEKYPEISESQVSKLQISGIRSCEQYVDLNPENCGQMGFGYKALQEDMRKWLKERENKPKRKPKTDVSEPVDGNVHYMGEVS